MDIKKGQRYDTRHGTTLHITHVTDTRVYYNIEEHDKTDKNHEALLKIFIERATEYNWFLINGNQFEEDLFVI